MTSVFQRVVYGHWTWTCSSKFCSSSLLGLQFHTLLPSVLEEHVERWTNRKILCCPWSYSGRKLRIWFVLCCNSQHASKWSASVASFENSQTGTPLNIHIICLSTHSHELCSPSLQQLISGCWAHDPQQRPTTDEVLQGLTEILFEISSEGSWDDIPPENAEFLFKGKSQLRYGGAGIGTLLNFEKMVRG